MGSDSGPEPAVRAAARLSLKGGTRIVLVGHTDALHDSLNTLRYDPAWLSIQHAPDVIEMSDKARESVAGKPDASLMVATKLVAEGQADALVTAGNTGAAILAAVSTFELLPGVKRAALAAVVPSPDAHGDKNDPFSLILDVGATMQADADTLVSFARMGDAYVRIISRDKEPKVALLSNGVEPTKGPPAVVEAHRRLLDVDSLRFVGNIEGVDIPQGKANVIVTDGYTGNIVLKMYEGMGESLLETARYAQHDRLAWRAGMYLLQSGIQRMRRVYDWREYGGAPLLGFRQLLIKAHGRSGGRAIANAVKVAAKAIKSDLAGRIADSMKDTP